MTPSRSAQSQKQVLPVDALPLASQLIGLPRWAIVAFVARCARRFQPSLPNKLKELNQLADNAIGVAEEAAEWGMDMGGAEVAALRLIEESDRWGYRSNPTVVVAASAAVVAALANVGNKSDKKALAEQGGHAMNAIADAASTNDVALQLIPLVTRDFEAIRKAAESESWDDDSRVVSTRFGQLSEEGRKA